MIHKLFSPKFQLCIFELCIYVDKQIQRDSRTPYKVIIFFKVLSSFPIFAIKYRYYILRIFIILLHFNRNVSYVVLKERFNKFYSEYSISQKGHNIFK